MAGNVFLSYLSIRNPAHTSSIITLRQLLQHTSSIVDPEQYWTAPSNSIAALAAQTSPFDSLHAPGNYFRYGNLNYVLIGQILERAGGQRFDQLMLNQIFRPGTNGSVFSPHGGLRISVAALARWASQLTVQQLADLGAKPWLIRVDGSNGDSENGFYRKFGLGAHGFVLPGVGEVWGHFGEAYGLTAAVLRDPDSTRVWAYAITGYGDDPARYPSKLPGINRLEARLLALLVHKNPAAAN